MLLRPKWLIRLKQKGRQREVRGGRNWELRVQEKLNGLLQKVERGSCSLAQPGMEGSWSSLKRPAVITSKWQELLWTCFLICKTGMRLPASWGPRTGEAALRCFTPDSASWTVLSGASPLKWLMCGSSLPASLHDLDCQACVLPAQSSLQIGLPWARWRVCMLVCECVCLDPAPIEQRCVLAYLMPEHELWLPVAKSLVKKCSKI